MPRISRHLTLLPALALCITAAAESRDAKSVQKDVELGKQAAAQVVTQMGIYEDESLTGYLKQIGMRLVKGLADQPFEYQFAIADEREPNAFALPGGFVFATRGIFAVANSEDELAGVFGHEIIHADRRHAIKAMNRSILPGILSIPGGVVGAFNQEAGAIINAPVTASTARYGRSQETEADELGAALAAKAGYDPAALSSCLVRLTKTVELLTGETEKPSYFRDHPLTSERVERLSKIVTGLQRNPQPGIAKTREDFLRRLDGLIIGQDPAQGIVVENVYLHPELNFRAELPRDWKVFNTPLAFGAAEKNGKAQMVFGLVKPGVDAETAAAKTIEFIQKKYRKKPAESKPVVVDGNRGYYAAYAEGSKKKAVTFHLLWLTVDDKVFRVVAAGSDDFREAMRNSVFSLKRLSAADRKSIKVLRLRVVPARAGETVEELSRRAENIAKPGITAVLNDIAPDTKLKQGQLLKVARLESYTAPSKR